MKDTKDTLVLYRANEWYFELPNQSTFFYAEPGGVKECHILDFDRANLATVIENATKLRNLLNEKGIKSLKGFPIKDHFTYNITEVLA